MKTGVHSIRRGTILVLLVTAMVGLTPTIVAACPTCGETLAEQSSGIDQGYAASILFMMGVPYVILVSWWFCCWRAISRHRRSELGAIEAR